MPTVKITLQCDKCDTNYRYNYIYKVLPFDSRLLIMYHGSFVRYDQYGCELGPWWIQILC